MVDDFVLTKKDQKPPVHEQTPQACRAPMPRTANCGPAASSSGTPPPPRSPRRPGTHLQAVDLLPAVHGADRVHEDGLEVVGVDVLPERAVHAELDGAALEVVARVGLGVVGAVQELGGEDLAVRLLGDAGDAAVRVLGDLGAQVLVEAGERDQGLALRPRRPGEPYGRQAPQTKRGAKRLEKRQTCH